MEHYEGAEVCELVKMLILFKLSQMGDKKRPVYTEIMV